MSMPDSKASGKIIVVDDDQLVRDFSVHTIEYGSNRKVKAFEDGFQAWKYIKGNEDSVDVIFADQNIPEMEGLELLHQVKANYPEKVFIITSSNPSLEQSAYQLGADAFICKPFDVADLFEIVEKFVCNPSDPISVSDFLSQSKSGV